MLMLDPLTLGMSPSLEHASPSRSQRCSTSLGACASQVELVPAVATPLVALASKLEEGHFG